MARAFANRRYASRLQLEYLPPYRKGAQSGLSKRWRLACRHRNLPTFHCEEAMFVRFALFRRVIVSVQSQWRQLKPKHAYHRVLERLGVALGAVWESLRLPRTGGVCSWRLRRIGQPLFSTVYTKNYRIK